MPTWQDGLHAVRTQTLKLPWLYQGAQALRDSLLHRQGLAAGSFAQHGEDLQLIRLIRELGAKGPYLDIGANHPFKLSNTYLLYLSGWRGVCVDPLPRFKALFSRWRPQDRFVCTAIGETAGEIELHQMEWDPISTVDGVLAEQCMQRGFRRLRIIPVPVRTIDSVLEEAGVAAPLSFLSIDIEGHELPALRSMNLEKWQPAVICLEALTQGGSRNLAAVQHLQAHGYRVHSDLGLNVILVRDT
jgi:FkbM family methyltransferase